MAYTGAAQIIKNPAGSKDLSRDIYIETLEAFRRTLIGLNTVSVQTISQGKAGQFIIGGKTTNATTPATYARGTQISIQEAEFEERTILLERPVYEARRIDQFEEKVAHYDVRSIITNQMGEALGNKVDRKVFDTIFESAGGTGLVHNPSSGQVAVIDVAGATDVKAKGDLIAEAIFAGVAQIKLNDVGEMPVTVLDPLNYSYLVQSGRMVSTDFTSGNGGLDVGTVHQVAGSTILVSNNVKGNNGGAGGATEKLIGLMYTADCAGVLEFIGMTTNQEKQIDFLDSTLMTAYYANGMGVLRPESALKIMAK